MGLIVSAVLPLFALVLSGAIAARFRLLGPEATDIINRFVVWLALPALLFQVLAQARFAELAQWGYIVAYGGGMLATFALSMVLLRRPEVRVADGAIEGLDAAYANAGFMGIPLALALFGEAAVPPAVVAAILTVCGVFAVAITLIEFDLTAGATTATVLRKLGASLIRNPLLVAPALGALYATTGWPLPVAVQRFTTLLGGAASPCALVTIGLFLAQRTPGGDWRVVTRLVVLKLAVQPALTGVLAFGVFSMPPLWSHCAVLMSALPTGTGPFMLARLYGRDAGTTSQAILVSTVVSLVTLAALVAVLGRV